MIWPREDDAWSAPALKKYATGLSKRDAALATALVGGVRKTKRMCDFYLCALLQGSFEKGSSARAGCPAHGGVSNGLMDRVPNSAAVNESVRLARSLCRADARTVNYVNGLLRTIARHADQLPQPDCETKAEYYSLRYSHPRWLTELYLEQFGVKQTRLLLEADNEPARTVLRVNTRKADAETVKSRLVQQGVSVQVHESVPNCLTVSGTGQLGTAGCFPRGTRHRARTAQAR